jgi:hypothetical protein
MISWSSLLESVVVTVVLVVVAFVFRLTPVWFGLESVQFAFVWFR